MTGVRPSNDRRRTAVSLAALALAGLAGVACGGDDDSSADAAADPSATSVPHDRHAGVDAVALLAATRATADFQDLDVAVAAGYVSTIDSLGCFHDAEHGGMGLHHLNEGLLDDQLDPATPEALVYELDGAGDVAGLVGLEYIVPVDAWTADEPPTVLGLDLHEHPTLPLWVLHAWIWKDNPAGTFEDFNPTVRSCPDGVPVFGVDLP